jgi:exopolysaccharide biosynthesis polyprenyl glycosylphosphotransferase
MERDDRRSLVIAIGDLLLVPSAYAGAFFVRFGTLAQFLGYFSPVFLLILTGAYLTVFYFFDLYSVTKKTRNRTLARRIILAVGASAVLASLLKYVLFLFPIGRGVLAIANTMLVVLIFAWRKAGFRLLRLMGNPVPVLLVGSGKDADEIISLLMDNPGKYHILGVLTDEGAASGYKESLSAARIIGTPIQLGEVLKSLAVKIVVLAESDTSLSVSTEALFQAHRSDVDVVDVIEMYRRLKFRIPVDFIKDESWFLQTKGFALANDHIAGKIKRLFDIGLAGFLLLISLPLWPLIAFLIKIESKGPIFYGQNRVGKNGTVFLLQKFRSMIDKAEDNEPVWAKENDHRVTHVGRIMRKLHLDELPQLWNVLRGEMSLVGPRPERPEFVVELKREVPYYALRHFVKPGLTGWAQINYPYAASTKDSKVKLEYDLYYVSNMNLIFDLKIIVMTMAGIISGRHQED